MISTKAIQYFKDNGYSFEEIERIKKWAMEIENGDTVPFEDVIKSIKKGNAVNYV